MYCKNCGKEIDNDSKFCNFCGANQVSQTSDLNKTLGAAAAIAAGAVVGDAISKANMDRWKEGMKESQELNDSVEKQLRSMGLIS